MSQHQPLNLDQDLRQSQPLNLDQGLLQASILEATQLLDQALSLPQLHGLPRVLVRSSRLRLGYFLAHSRLHRSDQASVSALRREHPEMAAALVDQEGQVRQVLSAHRHSDLSD